MPFGISGVFLSSISDSAPRDTLALYVVRKVTNFALLIVSRSGRAGKLLRLVTPIAHDVPCTVGRVRKLVAILLAEAQYLEQVATASTTTANGRFRWCVGTGNDIGRIAHQPIAVEQRTGWTLESQRASLRTLVECTAAGRIGANGTGSSTATHAGLRWDELRWVRLDRSVLWYGRFVRILLEVNIVVGTERFVATGGRIHIEVHVLRAGE